ncbi:NADPH-dependent FMN reductase [Marinicellulosiphila megalodicopiae]|uniref:NADPH-dependent FMN reductase n=1 Tax=Marinicellulosiphila megalodicopiae TaxID=2724896 RepID=UPI003BB13EAC
MKILAFAASNSRQSINKQLIVHATKVLKNEIMHNADIEILDLNDFEMPIFSIDREIQSGIPQLAHDFFDKISQSDAMIISFAEHNGNYSAAYKNIFDWASRIKTQDNKKVFQNKPMLMLATSPGKGGARNVLNIAVTSAPHFQGIVKGSMSVDLFSQKFDSEKKQLSDETLATQLRVLLNTLTTI